MELAIGGLGRRFRDINPFCSNWYSCNGPGLWDLEPSDARRTGL